MKVYVVIGNKKWDGSYIMGIHQNERIANEEVEKVNYYNQKVGVKTRYDIEIWDVEE